MLRRLLVAVGVLGILGIPALALSLPTPVFYTPCVWTTIYTDTDYLAFSGDFVSYRGTFYGGVTYRVEVAVPGGADFDVYVYRVVTDIYGNTTYIQVASGTLPGSANEMVYFTPSSTGTYVIKVVSYSGSGWYTLRVSRCSG